MEKLTIKRKEFEIVEQLGDKTCKVTRDGNFYVAKKFEVKSEEYFDYIYSANRMKSALILAPRIILKDKKTGYVLTNFIEGQTVLDYICENEIDEDFLYKKIFSSAHLAKVNGLALDFKPDNWVITDKGLACLKIGFKIYSKNLDFTQTDIRLWFVTKDLVRYAKEKGRNLDATRLKDEYLTNKNLVLMTCKYYM